MKLILTSIALLVFTGLLWACWSQAYQRGYQHGARDEFHCWQQEPTIAGDDWNGMVTAQRDMRLALGGHERPELEIRLNLRNQSVNNIPASAASAQARVEPLAITTIRRVSTNSASEEQIEIEITNGASATEHLLVLVDEWRETNWHARFDVRKQSHITGHAAKKYVFAPPEHAPVWRFHIVPIEMPSPNKRRVNDVLTHVGFRPRVGRAAIVSEPITNKSAQISAPEPLSTDAVQDAAEPMNHEPEGEIPADGGGR